MKQRLHLLCPASGVHASSQFRQCRITLLKCPPAQPLHGLCGPRRPSCSWVWGHGLLCILQMS